MQRFCEGHNKPYLIRGTLIHCCLIMRAEAFNLQMEQQVFIENRTQPTNQHLCLAMVCHYF